MIELYYWPTPNCQKIVIFLEEVQMPYTLKLVNIRNGDQFKEDYLNLNPNNKVPMIVDHDPTYQVEPMMLFESGAILMYLAEKTGRFLSANPKNRWLTIQWLMWQIGGLGSKLSQLQRVLEKFPDSSSNTVDQSFREATRLYKILDTQLSKDELLAETYLAGTYSIADMACFPWIMPIRQKMEMSAFPYLRRWYEQMLYRPAVRRAYAKAAEICGTERSIAEVRGHLKAFS